MQQNDPVEPNMLLAPDNEIFRRRYFEADEDAKFTDKLVFSDGHPGPHKWTVLEYSSANEWEKNAEQLCRRGRKFYSHFSK